ncbi:hypothetical protein LQF12_02070 [Ruania suaedae]|uniref:hypothetical protein n=1 Tax=Ruania suaedae TaxID=2897774 RepID=UPI001E4EE910|nr:hypothetical protein [Ruania suaedae]UFU03418.1 hypothetical protein LQF12_02070 [Ruania suaedae]
MGLQRECAVIGCQKPVKHRGLCTNHYSRTWRGLPLLGPPRMRVRSCPMCGASWGVLPGRKATVYCGPRCRRLHLIATHRASNRERDEQIVAGVQAGELHRVIAERLGVTTSTVSRVAARYGLRRVPYAPRRRA